MHDHEHRGLNNDFLIKSQARDMLRSFIQYTKIIIYTIHKNYHLYNTQKLL